MYDERDPEIADTLESNREPNGSEVVLRAIEEAERAFSAYMRFCLVIDRTYSLSRSQAEISFTDEEFAIFWASMEILKPAIYAKPPKPIASPRFKDGGAVEKVTAELIERCLESTFDRSDIDLTMLGVRDDLALTNRGVAWVTYESDEAGGGQRVCLEHLDRADFLHEPAMSWAHVGWVARRAWMTKRQMQKRFDKLEESMLDKAQFNVRREDRDAGLVDGSAKAGVWEVWSRTDDRVYWVTEGVPVMLDEDKPHLNLRGFFPCPRPAYGSLSRRSLIPVPDYRRYAYHLDQINDLTSRMYTLLNKVKLKGIVPEGGDIGGAVTRAMASEDDSILIPVPAAALMASGGKDLVVWVPLDMIASTIQGLIEARGQLMEDFYQLSGISDIMRGATEAQETLGAQQLKSQYGSVRVRDKIDEIVRLSRDLACIAGEIISANFSKETLLDLSRMTIPTKAEIKRKTAEVEKAAKDALEALRAEVEQAQSQQMDEQQAAAMEKQFAERQQAIIAQHQPILRQLGEAVPIEDVMEMLRDEKTRNLVIDIETDSTVLTDEIAEKQSRSEFLQAFSSASTAIIPLLQAGEAGAKLAGGILKFALQPYRANRELDALIDDFVDKAPAMAAQMGGEGQGDDTAALAEAQNKLAEAEMAKAQAQTAKVQADAQLKAAELQGKMQKMQTDAMDAERKSGLELEALKGTLAETQARIQKIYAEVALIQSKTGIDAAKAQNDARKTDIEEFRTVSDVQARQTDQAMSAQDRERQAFESDRNHEMGERQQSFSERQAERETEDAD